MQEMTIHGVSFDVIGKQPIVLLKSVTGNRYLPIWIGQAEAQAIISRLQGAETPRPMTHDLLTDVVAELNAEIARITVTELRDSTFYALITLRRQQTEIEVDSRPSDAIALAIRAGAPIFVADQVIEENGLEIPEDSEETVERFKEFLDQVTPDDFAGS